MNPARKLFVVSAIMSALTAAAAVLALRASIHSSQPAAQASAGSAAIDSSVSGSAAPAGQSFSPAQPQGDYLPVLFDAPGFALVDQDAKPFKDTDLGGSPWIADFIFTQCASACPIMSARLSALQPKIDSRVKFVSFSVDPANDTPAVLRNYAAKYHAQAGRWIFLTGPQKTVAIVVRAMKMYFAPAGPNQPIEHDRHFILFDAQNHARAVYDSYVSDDIDRMVADANQLARSAQSKSVSGSTPTATADKSQ